MTTGRTRGGFGGSRELGKYKLVNELAKSQLGALWAGIGGDAPEGEEATLVLVRRFDTRVIESPDQVDNLSEAAWWAMEHSHDQIARTLDVVKTENELGMVYAYNEGEVLRALLRLATFKRKPFPVPVALRIALDVLEALATVRAQATEDHIELSCGGLSPDSVLVGTDGTARLLDVGAAGVLCSADRVLRNPEMTAYAAPEQLEEPARAGPRADVFTGGVLIWEMLLGKRLFVGSNYAAVSAKVKEAKVSRLDAAKPVGSDPIPKNMAALVARALKPDPAERFGDCRELIAAIEALSIEPAERKAVGEMVDALDGNALATRRKVIDRARGVQSPAAKPVAKRAPSPVAAPPKPTSSPNAAPAPPKPPAKPAGRRPPPPPPRARMESLDPELLEPAGDSEAPESAGVAVDVEFDAPAVPSDLTAEPAGKANATGTQPAGDEGDDTETAEPSEGAEGSGGDDVPPPPPEMQDIPLPPPGLSEPALIEALTNDSTPKPEATDEGGSEEAETGKAADDGSGAEPAAGSSPEASSSPGASSSPEAAATATTLDATSDDDSPTSLANVDARTQRARRVVGIVIGGLALLLLAGLGISALRGSGKPKQDSSAAAPPPAAPSQTAPAATASETTPAASASAEPEQAAEEDAGSEDAGDAAAETAAEDSGTAEAAPSATEAETAAPAPPPRPKVRRHYKPRPRPKHKFTPSGI